MIGELRGRVGVEGVAPEAELLLLAAWPQPLADAGTSDTEGSRPLFSACASFRKKWGGGGLERRGASGGQGESRGRLHNIIDGELQGAKTEGQPL